jgi:intracellular multiplication protein IcmP
MASQGNPNERTVTMDDPMVIVAFAAAIYFLVWAAWYFGHAHISMVYGYVRYAQFYLFHALGSFVNIPGVSVVHDWLGELCAPDGVAGVCTRDFGTVSWPEIADSSMWVNGMFFFAAIAFSVRMYLYASKNHPKFKYARSHNLASFVKEFTQAKDAEGNFIYPHLRLFSALSDKLISSPLDHPKFGMSLTSKSFAFRNRLVTDWRQEGQGFWAPTLNREASTRVFREQLGRLWTSSANMSPGETMLFAIACPRVAATDPSIDDKTYKQAMADSMAMIRYCWAQFTPPEASKKSKGKEEDFGWLVPDISLEEPRQVIKRYIGLASVQSIIEKHAYNRTILFAMYMHARRLGVLQPAEMRWLRFYDRPLWYVLQTIGRQAGYAEASGVLSHYLYEAKAGSPLVEPQLDKAVSGLEAALANYKFTDADKDRYVNAQDEAAKRATPATQAS